jgi:hypothetical protein
MKKSIIALSVLAAMSTAHAGSMGPVTSVQPNYTPFVSAEGSYTWSSFMPSSAVSVKSTDPWGGRLAVGVNRPWNDNWGLSFETGYGYYGNASNVASMTGGNTLGSGTINVTNKIDVLGADILAGLSFTHNQFDLFAKAGMMVQTLWEKGTAQTNMSMLSVINVASNVVYRDAQTAVLPEIKVGGNYNFNEAMGLSLAYMHVFGSSQNGAAMSVPAGEISPISMKVNMQPVILNAIMLGIHYNFV